MDKLTLFSEGCFSEATFDKDKVRINGVVLLGKDSRNDRVYTDDCRRQAVGLYEGIQAFVDHPSSDELKTGQRSVRNLAGVFENARLDDAGKVRGDFVGLPNANGQLFLQIAETAKTGAGMSHNAFGKWRRDNGKQVVECIDRVESVDLVARPATTCWMFEGEGQPAQTEEGRALTPEEVEAVLITRIPSEALSVDQVK